MLCFSWSVAISTCNPHSHASHLFHVHAQALSQALHTHTLMCSPVKSFSDQWRELEWRFLSFFFIFFQKTKAPNCIDMATLDLRHYWVQSREEPCNLQDLLVHGFFPYLLQWRYAATQSPTGVTVAFSGGLIWAEATACATSTDAFLYVRAHVHTRTIVQELACPVAPLSSKHAHAAHASSCSLLSRHTAGVRWGLGGVICNPQRKLFYCSFVLWLLK